MASVPTQPKAEHVAQTGQAQNPTPPNHIFRWQSFFWMQGEISLAGLHQARRFLGESRTDDHGGKAKHVGFALVLGGLRTLPGDEGAAR